MAGIPRRGYPEGPVLPSWLTGIIPGSPANYYKRYRQSGSSSGKPQMPGLPTNYKTTELAAGAAAEAFRPGAGFPGQQGGYSPAAERAYQTEKSRVAQLTAQDPELKRYEDARLKAVAPGATPEQVQSAEDIGMQIWAQKYGKPGGLASKVKPGQAGYDVIQRTLFSQGTSLPPLSKASQAMLNEIAPINAQGVRENIMPMPGQMPVFSEASEAMYQAVTDGGKLVTPMPSPQAKMTQEAAAQSLADAYKSSIVGDDEFAQRLRAMQQYMQ